MRIALFNCSPRVNSSSEYLLRLLRDTVLQISPESELVMFGHDFVHQAQEDPAGYQKIVIAAPVYVATVPAQMIDLLEHIFTSGYFQESTEVFLISNSGFCKAEASRFSVEVVQRWCERCGFIFRHAMCVSSGWRIDPRSITLPKIRGNALKKVISFAERLFSYDSLIHSSTGLSHAIEEMAKRILVPETSGTVTYVEPAFPKTQLAGNLLFNSLILVKRIIIFREDHANERTKS